MFRKKGERQALCVFGKPVQKGNGMIMLPDIGTINIHGEMTEWDMRSFQLVETTKRITKHTEDCNRTYRLHIQVRIETPKPVECDSIRGVDMGIVHNATTVDLGTGYAEFHDIPDSYKRMKGDGISRMYAKLSRKREMYAKLSRKRDCSGSNRNKPRKPKPRGYRELQRRIQKKREKMANRQKNGERHAAKRISLGAGTVCIEDLNLKVMTARARGRGSSAKRGLNRETAYSRPRAFLSQIGQTCENMGVAVITVDPRGTSITCHVCGKRDRDSRRSQAEFQCTNHDCGYAGNADVNAAHSIAIMTTAGRLGRSSEGARFQRGIAPTCSANNTQEPRVGGSARKSLESPLKNIIPPKPISDRPGSPA